MRKLLKLLIYPWEQQKKRKQELERLLKVAGVKLIKERNTSITLSCLKYIDDNKGTHSIVNEVDNSIVYDTGLTSEQAANRMAQYTKDSKIAYPKLSGDEALTKYMAQKINRIKITVENTENIGKLGKNGASMRFSLIDKLKKKVGLLIRSNERIVFRSNTATAKISKLIYSLKYKGVSNKVNSEILLLNRSHYDLTVREGEKLIYADINISKHITDEASGIGTIILDDALSLFRNNTKYDDVNGIFGFWLKNDDYYKINGGKSENLKDFWNAMSKNGNNVEKSAFSTFTGNWAKKNGFTKVVVENPKTDILENYVLIKFLKP